jgi:hypothetical protein
MDVPDTTDTYEANCPKCNHSFTIKCAQKNKSAECGWEEHGEPRKTILSSLKPHTTKPMIASFLLLTSCVLGIFTAVFLYSSNNLIVLGISLSYLTDMIGTIGLFFIVIIFSIFAFAAFIATLKRRYLNVAVVGAFFSIFSIGFFVGLVLSIIALALIILSKEEFENGTKGKVFQ